MGKSLFYMTTPSAVAVALSSVRHMLVSVSAVRPPRPRRVAACAHQLLPLGGVWCGREEYVLR